MTIERPVYVLDADVFIEAHKRYYSFDIAPGFWAALLKYAKQGEIISIDKVQDEINDGYDLKNPNEPDDLAIWATEQFQPYFMTTKTEEVLQEYSKMIIWALNNDYYGPAVKYKFADYKKADCWVIAYAKAYNKTLVTDEIYSNTKKKIPIPNVCKEFDVHYVNTFQMLRNLGIILN
ncbi:MAG: DUF4411 family protein [Candidatus Cloacimonas sp.]